MAIKDTASKAAKAELGVIDIELTAEQREHIRYQSKGKLDIAIFRLRPDLNLRLRELAGVLSADPKIRQSIANSGGQYWV